MRRVGRPDAGVGDDADGLALALGALGVERVEAVLLGEVSRGAVAQLHRVRAGRLAQQRVLRLAGVGRVAGQAEHGVDEPAEGSRQCGVVRRAVEHLGRLRGRRAVRGGRRHPVHALRDVQGLVVVSDGAGGADVQAVLVSARLDAEGLEVRLQGTDVGLRLTVVVRELAHRQVPGRHSRLDVGLELRGVAGLQHERHGFLRAGRSRRDPAGVQALDRDGLRHDDLVRWGGGGARRGDSRERQHCSGCADREHAAGAEAQRPGDRFQRWALPREK